MNRSIIASAICMTLLVGCASATPTAAPTRTAAPAPTQPAAATSTPAATVSPAPPTNPPAATPSTTDEPRQLTTDSVEPGRYFVDSADYRYTFTVADPGWMADTDAGALYQGEDPEIAIFWPVLAPGEFTSLYRDPCESSGTEFQPGPSVEGLVDALASLDGFEATTPVDVVVSGYGGKRVAITVPADVDVNSSACDRGNYSLSETRWYQAPGQTDDLRILNLSGYRRVVSTSTTPATPPDVAAQLDDLVESLVIEPI